MPGLVGCAAQELHVVVPVATAGLFIGLIVTVICFFVGGWAAGLVALLVLGMALAVVSVTDKHNKSVGERAFARLAFRSARRKKANLYRSGPLGLTPWGEYQLPGIAAGSKLYEFADSYGRPFALIHLPSTAHYTVVFGTQPDGASLVDPEQIDAWVANWGGWLASLSNEPAVVAASVTVETAPDSGARLRREVESNIHEDAPAIAKAMLREALETYPQGSATIRAWVTLTFSAAARAGGKRRTADEIARDLASRLPGLTERLESTGAGACAPLNAQELCEVVRVAYDPAAARLIDEAHYQGTPVDLTWGEVGPSAHQAGWDRYRHDSGHSVSWTMTGAPRGHVLASVLARLVAPHGEIARKRVTLLYRPIESGRAAAIVESDQTNALTRASSTSRPTARALVDARAATATAAEEAKGAGLVNFGLVVTATVLSSSALDDAVAVVEGNLGPSARLLMRRVYGSQDSAFAASLPLGLVLPKHLKVPEEIREAM
ncbi:SCO6880 family protein [Pseudarthrobacter defluvii]|uniref:SCO6880 family protein n=1 Tax=Pseudarthrobacter defluvii TaxID=410837 RepID=UPI003DA9AC13